MLSLLDHDRALAAIRGWYRFVASGKEEGVAIEPLFRRIALKVRAVQPASDKILEGEVDEDSVELVSIKKLVVREVQLNRARNLPAEHYRCIEEHGVHHVYRRERKRDEACQAVIQAALRFERGQKVCSMGLEYWTAKAKSVKGLAGKDKQLDQPVITDFNCWMDGNPLVKSVFRLI
jgi:hypothetical protein